MCMLMFLWTFEQAETSFYTVVDSASTAVFLFQTPLKGIDRLLCQSLDFVESKVPSINLPPEVVSCEFRNFFNMFINFIDLQIYYNTKQYVSDVGTKLVRPVLKRADSAKQIGNSVLASKYTAFAADKLDGALDVADMYVYKDFPVDLFDSPNSDGKDPLIAL